MQQRLSSGRSFPWATLVAVLFVLALSGPDVRSSASPDMQQMQRGFIENRGQIDAEVRYYAAGNRMAVYFTLEGPVLEIRRLASPDGAGSEPTPAHPTRRREQRTLARAQRFAMAIRFVDVDSSVEVHGASELPAPRHYLSGSGPEQWRIDVPSFDQVIYRNVWPGIDLVYRIAEAGLFYEIVATPGADLEAVKFRYEGVNPIRDTDAVRRLSTPLGTIEDRQPVHGDRVGTILVTHEIDATVTDRPATARSSGRAPGDPVLGMYLWWSTFLGGTRDDAVYAVALDDQDRPFVTGSTLSTDFPTTFGVVDSDYNGSFDSFVTKLDEDGATVLWSTYLGASADDRGWAISVDDSNRPIVAGITSSSDFPVTPGAYDMTHNGGYDAYVTKLAADGTALVWSSYFGGNDREWDVSGIALDDTGGPVVIGSTRSTDLPTSTGAYSSSLGGTEDAFAAALSADGSTLLFGTYLGGTGSDAAEDVVLDSVGRPVVIGDTASTDFPVTAGAFQPAPGGLRDAFVTKLAADAGSLVFSTFLGGDGDDDGFGIVLDDADVILATGATTSGNFPTTAGAFSTTYAGGRDVFVTRLTADATAQIWGTYVGGTFEERGLDIVVDSVGRPIFVGWTCSTDFPIAGPPLDDEFFTCDGFLSRLTADGSVLLYSSFIGGWRDDSAYGMALSDTDRVLVGGETFSPNFPVTPNAYDTTHNSPNDWYDAFVMQLLTPEYCTYITGTADPLLMMTKAVDGNCPPGPAPEGEFIDLVEGHLEAVGPADVGVVWRLACNSPDILFENDLTPEAGLGLFQIARFRPDGTYIDGANPGLTGSRLILDGDCP